MEAYVGVLYSGDLTYSQAMLMDKNKHAGITQYRRIDLLWGGGDYGRYLVKIVDDQRLLVEWNEAVTDTNGLVNILLLRRKRGHVIS